MHDIGKLVTSRYFKADCQDVVACAAERGLTFVAAERQLFGTDHAQVGAAIGREWGFPLPIVDAIARHHSAPLGESTPVLDAVVVANFVAKTLGVGLGAEGFNFALEAQSAERLGLDTPSFGRVCLRTEEWLTALRAALRRPRREPASR
jgi:putative nucleotidyltransferase with HDIG domain